MMTRIDKPRIRKYRLGTEGHSKTLEAIYEYRIAKLAGKKCFIVAKDEKSKLRLAVNHGVDPLDIKTKAEMDRMNLRLN